MSQRDLALASGLGLPTLRALEDGIPNPPFEDLIRLADALDTRIAVLVRDAEARMRELEAAGSRHWQFRRSADELEATLTFTLGGGRLANFVASRLFNRG
jgi:transcriptional regulator with XRE-family HTH domain